MDDAIRASKDSTKVQLVSLVLEANNNNNRKKRSVQLWFLYNMLPAFLSIHTTSSEKKDGTSFALQISTPSINIFFLRERVREKHPFLLLNAEIKSSVFVNDDSTNDWSGRDLEIIFLHTAASYLHDDAPQSLRLSSFLHLHACTFSLGT